MQDVFTRTPAALTFKDGQWWSVTPVTINDVQWRVWSPLGDGRRHAESVFERIMAPAIAPRPTDRRR